MLSGVCVGTNDLLNAREFYDSVLSTLAWLRVMENEVEIGYGPSEGQAQFWVLIPFDQKPATFGNGTQVMFLADNTAQVDAFYTAAIKNGGSDEGAPGPRNYRPGYYGAYCRDPDGNKLHVYTINQS